MGGFSGGAPPNARYTIALPKEPKASKREGARPPGATPIRSTCGDEELGCGVPKSRLKILVTKRRWSSFRGQTVCGNVDVQDFEGLVERDGMGRLKGGVMRDVVIAKIEALIVKL